MIKIAKIDNDNYQVDDNEIPLSITDIRNVLTSYAGMSDIQASQWLDELDDKKENTFEEKIANKGVVVNMYEVDYNKPQDPNKETQEIAKHLNEYNDFVSQIVYPDTETEDVVVDLRKNLENNKMPKNLNWRMILRDAVYDPDIEKGWGMDKRNKIQKENVIKLGDTYYQFLQSVKSSQLQVGNIYGASYSAYNSGYDLIKFKGLSFTKDATGPEVSSVKELLQKIGAKSLSDLSKADLYLHWKRPQVWEKLNNFRRTEIDEFFRQKPELLNLNIENDYCMWGDYSNHDGTWDEDKDYFYLDEGRWVRGSGAEKLTFWIVEEVEVENNEETPNLNWRQNLLWDNPFYIPGNPNQFFKTDTCDRCKGDLKSGRTMSWFNDDTICMQCSEKEREYKNKLDDKGSSQEGSGQLPIELQWRDVDKDGVSTMYNKKYNKSRNPEFTSQDSTRAWLLRLLNTSGPLSLMDIWKKYVTEFKNETVQDHEPIWESLSERGPKYYQGISARLTDLDIAGLVGRVQGKRGNGWSITEKGARLIEGISGDDKIKLHWQDAVNEFKKGMRVRFKIGIPEGNRTFEDDDGNTFIIDYAEVGTVSENPDPNFSDVPVLFPKRGKIPLVCYNEDLESLDPPPSILQERFGQ